MKQAGDQLDLQEQFVVLKNKNREKRHNINYLQVIEYIINNSQMKLTTRATKGYFY